MVFHLVPDLVVAKENTESLVSCFGIFYIDYYLTSALFVIIWMTRTCSLLNVVLCLGLLTKMTKIVI